MVKHIVIFKLTPPLAPGEKEESVRKLKEFFGPVGNRLDYIIEYRTGVNITEDDHSGDFVIDATFASREDLKRYQVSEPHRGAVAAAKTIKKAKVVVDYII
ncbi:MAG: Dabb family protein [Bacteroidales bacterium]|nr:Dabb family protein [Bacteroidales bacterium]MDT8374023.1 Dabb family protein [Bacteroidales bacterium]